MPSEQVWLAIPGSVDTPRAAAEPVFTELIAAADVTIGETVMATGLDR